MKEGFKELGAKVYHKVGGKRTQEMKFNLDDDKINLKKVSDGYAGGYMKLMPLIRDQFMADPKNQVIEKVIPGQDGTKGSQMRSPMKDVSMLFFPRLLE